MFCSSLPGLGAELRLKRARADGAKRPKRKEMRYSNTADPVDAAALQCRRFWLPRGAAPDLSDNGFLVNPESGYSIFTTALARPLEAFEDIPALGLLGEPGMGKSTVLNQEALRLETSARQSGDRFLHVDLAACGTDVLVCKRIFESNEFRAWKETKTRLHLLLDGFDTCLRYVKTLVALLLCLLYTSDAADD